MTIKRITAMVLAAVLCASGMGALASEITLDSTLLYNPIESRVEEWMAETANEEVVVDQLLLPVEDYAINEDLPDDWVNILLLGTDERTGKSYGRTDSMIVLSVNLKEKKAKLTSLMRDIWVSIDGRSGKSKLNAACVYGGPGLTMRTINQNFGLNIKYYALVNLTCMADIIDMLGGLRLDVTEAERRALNKGLFDLSSRSGMERLAASGEQVLLNGNQAVAYARIRQIDSDYRRTERQRTVLTTLARRLQQETTLSIAGILTELSSYVETNLTLPQLLTLACTGLQIDMDDVEQLRIPVDGTYTSGMYSSVWCIRPNFEKNRAALYSFIYE